MTQFSKPNNSLAPFFIFSLLSFAVLSATGAINTVNLVINNLIDIFESPFFTMFLILVPMMAIYVLCRYEIDLLQYSPHYFWFFLFPSSAMVFMRHFDSKVFFHHLWAFILQTASFLDGGWGRFLLIVAAGIVCLIFNTKYMLRGVASIATIFAVSSLINNVFGG